MINFPSAPVREPLFSSETPIIDNGSWLGWLKNLWAGMFGINQKYQDMTAGRTLNPYYSSANDYINNTGRPIFVMVSIEATGSTSYVEAIPYIDGNVLFANVVATPTSGYYTVASFFVPSGSTYQVTSGTGSETIFTWKEYR